MSIEHYVAASFLIPSSLCVYSADPNKVTALYRYARSNRDFVQVFQNEDFRKFKGPVTFRIRTGQGDENRFVVSVLDKNSPYIDGIRFPVMGFVEEITAPSIDLDGIVEFAYEVVKENNKEYIAQAIDLKKPENRKLVDELYSQIINHLFKLFEKQIKEQK